MKDDLKGSDGGIYRNDGLTTHYNKSFIPYIKLEELTGGSIFAYLACQTQVNKYAKRIGLKDGVPVEKDYVKMSFYRKAADFYKERVDYVNKCIKQGIPIDNRKGYAATLDIIDLIAPQVFSAHNKPVLEGSNLSYDLESVILNK
jgi:hypothetical protein